MSMEQSILKYEISENDVSITGIKEEVAELVIPSNIKGVPVTTIEKEAFKQCTSLTRVTIPGSVKSIKQSAFSWCEKLKSVIIEDGVKEIGNYAFMDCHGLGKVGLPDSIQVIGEAAFSHCENLKEIKFPFGLAEIGEMAFSDCKSLSRVLIPGSVKVINALTFARCEKLESVTMQKGVSVIGDMAFKACPMLKSVEMPTGIQVIGESAFTECVKLKEIHLPFGIAKIGEMAFDECIGLTQVTIPGSVKLIDRSTFAGCKKLDTVIIEDGVITIGYMAFWNCVNLRSVEIPDSLLRIEDSAFSSCSSLKKINIPDSVEDIAEDAFLGCDNLADREMLLKKTHSTEPEPVQEELVERKDIRKKLQVTKNIFISSTFRDMQAERDMVQERVLPALRETAKKYGENVGVIDLRWGVDTSTLETEEGSEKVLKVCLDEIDRSHPYMLIFLGERYGWIPNGKLIEKAICDRNDKYETNDFEKSVTALEIEYGALSEKYGDLTHCVVCFREPVAHLMDEEHKAIYEEQSEKALEKLHLLKERIKRDLGSDDLLISYSCDWDSESGTLVNFQSGGKPLDQVLTGCFEKMFRADWKEYEKLTWQDREQLIYRTLIESKLRSFSGREELLEEYYQKAVNSNHPIILRGATGSGKTALMCKLIERLESEGKNVFYFFSGAGAESGTAELLVRQMQYYLENLLGLWFSYAEGVVPTYDNWHSGVEMLCERIPDGEKVYFVIDALDQLIWDEHVRNLDFLMSGEKFEMILSCTDTFELPVKVEEREWETVNVRPLSENDAKKVLEGMLSAYSRNTYQAIEQEILKKKSIDKPLYVSLLVQRLNMMDAEELKHLQTEEEIVAFGKEIVRCMPDDLEKAAVTIIGNAVDKIAGNKSDLYEIVNYLAVSRNGLRMKDIQWMIQNTNLQISMLDFSLLIKYLDSFFYIQKDDRIDFTHKVIRQGLRNEISNPEKYERDIKECIKSLEEEDAFKVREGMYYARIFKDYELGRSLLDLQQTYYIRDQLVKLNKINIDFGETILLNAIKNESVADSGAFLSEIIRQNTSSLMLAMLSNQVIHLFDRTEEEMAARLAITEAILSCREKEYEEDGDDNALRDLTVAYSNMGDSLLQIKRPEEALTYFTKDLQGSKEIYRRDRCDKYYKSLAIAHSNVGRAMLALGNVKEAFSYLRKSLKMIKSLYKKGDKEQGLHDLSVAYNRMVDALLEVGNYKKAISYSQKAIKCVERAVSINPSEYHLSLCQVCYNDIGFSFSESGKPEMALGYYAKALEMAKKKYARTRNANDKNNLCIVYQNMAAVYRALGRDKEADSCVNEADRINGEIA